MSDDSLQHTQFDGVADYVAALDTVCSSAQHTLNIFEQNYEDIGFNSEARFDILRHFLLASPINRLNLLVHDPQHLIRFCPRMMMLLRQFGHGMFIYQTPRNLQNITEPFAVADDAHYVRRFHFDDTRGLLAQNDPEGARLLNSRFHEMWTSSHPCASGTTLGL
ncbi:DUF7931 domain-containing protein [Sideroxydans lithotrophicus]|uniref:DUF7931 domain-containing protein n=1 Tax=Sideroxydans lithotrophicus (strain ES-1) TaxID=580332 RepID=D5CLS0_SIDLE|nr:hypothetical protein [Sideroxydans lithotrophicus]ADE12515.1 conserved hypothetical protein [Sideroxydans lithotrophicus ES-1]